MGLSILLEQNGDKRILRLTGPLDAQTTPSLEKEIESLFVRQHRKVILDLTRVEDLSVGCLQMLFAMTKKFKEGKGALGLSDVNDTLMGKIQMAGFDRVLLLYCDEQTALKAMA